MGCPSVLVPGSSQRPQLPAGCKGTLPVKTMLSWLGCECYFFLALAVLELDEAGLEPTQEIHLPLSLLLRLNVSATMLLCFQPRVHEVGWRIVGNELGHSGKLTGSLMAFIPYVSSLLPAWLLSRGTPLLARLEKGMWRCKPFKSLRQVKQP